MIKKIRNIKVKIHRKVEKKEEKKGLLEKNKDLLDSLVAIGTLLGFVYVIVVVLLQYIYSKQAAKYYCIDWLYFLKEDLGLAINLSLVFVVDLFWLSLPFLPFRIERKHNHSVSVTEPNWSGKDTLELIMLCLPFFLFDLFICIFFSSILSDAINWYYTKRADAFRLGGCVLLVLLVAYVIQCIIRWRKKSLLLVFFNAKKIVILFICSLLLYFALPSHLFGDKAIQINSSFIILTKILSFILAQLFCFGKLSSKSEKPTGGKPKEPKDHNDCKNNQDQSKEMNLNIIQFFAVLLWTLFFAIIVLSFIYVFNLNLLSLNPRNKKFYEIVQQRETPNDEIDDEQKVSASNIQVVILHRGTQVLLMNGKIDDKEIINLQEDITSSSNLEIDTSSYEFQEASQYRFYRIKFEKEPTRATDKR